jgi:hypothetical protein
MVHHEATTDQSPESQLFQEYMMRGNDFFKIEIFRSAKSWYEKALSLKIDEDKVMHQIEECNRQLAYEKKVFIILGIIGFAAILAFLVI